MNDFNKRAKYRRTILLCDCCLVAEANGDTTGCDFSGCEHTPLSEIDYERFELLLGLLARDHERDCVVRKTGSHDALDGEQCDCEEQGFRAAGCDGCGSDLHGNRHAATLVPRVLPKRVPAAVAKVGDLIFLSSRVWEVDGIYTYPPVTADNPTNTDARALVRCPIRSDHVARRVLVSGIGSRWFGHLPGDRYRGSEIISSHPDGISFEVPAQP